MKSKAELLVSFKLAGKKSARIADLIDGFARLGRALSVNVILCTQNLSADIPKSAMGQVRLRMCLGCNQSTSEAVLNNTGASANFGRIGRLVVNTETFNSNNTLPFNVTYQTPFMPDSDFDKEMVELETKGVEVGYKAHMNFYDEEDMKTVATYEPMLDKAISRMSKAQEIGVAKSAVCLGMPAFVTSDVDNLLKIYLDHKDVENIVICSAVTEKMAAHIHNIAYSLKNSWTFLHYSSDVGMFQWTPNAIDCQEAREASQRPLDSLDGLIRKRLFLVYLDNLCKGENSIIYRREAVEKIFADENIPVEYRGNSFLCRRAAAFYAVQSDKQHESMWLPAKPYFPNFKAYFDECVKYNSIIKPVTVEKFSKVCYMIGDLSKIIGFGRDSNSKQVARLKKAMQDCNRAGIVFVLYSRSMDSLNDLLSGLRYVIFDSPDGKDYGRMRCDFGGTLSNRLSMLYDTVTGSQLKFKCTLLKEEF